MNKDTPEKYIKRIKNKKKKDYAKKYYAWIKNNKKGKEPDVGGLGHMGAQAVRMNIMDMTNEDIIQKIDKMLVKQ